MTGKGNGNGNGSEPQYATVKQACTLLYNALPPLNVARLQRTLQSVVGPCTVDWADAGLEGVPLVAGVAQFGQHRVIMVALNAPVREEVLDRTVGVSPMPEEVRQAMRAHRATIRLLYVGDGDGPVGQLLALYQVAAALISEDVLGLINERAALAIPVQLLASHVDQLGVGYPLPMPLWVGVVTFSVDGEEPAGLYLIRTYGMEQFDLPDLALHTRDRSTADDAYHTLLNICLYMVEGGSRLQIGPGHRADFKGRTYLFTDPQVDSPEYASPNGLLLLVEV